MKRFLVKLIEVYQKFSSARSSKCRMLPTCSQYAKIAILRFGSIKGLWLTMARLLRCAQKGGRQVDKVPQNIKGDFKWLI